MTKNDNGEVSWCCWLSHQSNTLKVSVQVRAMPFILQIFVQNARAKVYKEVYEKLDLYKIARMRERKTRDLYTVRCVKDEDQKVLVRDEEIKERWSILTKCSMIVLFKIWMTLPFSANI